LIDLKEEAVEVAVRWAPPTEKEKEHGFLSLRGTQVSY
jgi:hypothetical protein